MIFRKNITEMFSTFALLEAGKFSKWVTDTKLRRSIQSYLNNYPEVGDSEIFWAFYWYKYWQAKLSDLAKIHLLAYLQEPFYLVSQKTVAKYQNCQYGVGDYFQIVNAEVEIIIKHFNAEKSYSLKNYAIVAASSRLRDILRQRQEVDTCTDRRLLRRVSVKTFSEALSEAGLSQAVVAQYRLAWICFKELYVHHPYTAKQLPEPNHEFWLVIANLYNRERLIQLDFNTEECTSEKMRLWLTQSAAYLRRYFFPPVNSLNTLRKDSELEDNLNILELSSDSFMVEMIAQEDIESRKQQIAQMSDVLSNALQSLDTEYQDVLRLYYQEKLTQQQIMQQLHISQSTVSRRLVKGRNYLLAALVKWLQDLNMNNSVKSTQVEDMSVALEEYLVINYGSLRVEQETPNILVMHE
jgi:RNA polymerase sigma factor (sigma-70 family)